MRVEIDRENAVDTFFFLFTCLHFLRKRCTYIEQICSLSCALPVHNTHRLYFNGPVWQELPSDGRNAYAHITWTYFLFPLLAHCNDTLCRWVLNYGYVDGEWENWEIMSKQSWEQRWQIVNLFRLEFAIFISTLFRIRIIIPIDPYLLR